MKAEGQIVELWYEWELVYVSNGQDSKKRRRDIGSYRKQKESKSGYKDVGCIVLRALGVMCAKISSLLIQNALLYQNQIDCKGNSTSKMKQQSLKSNNHQKKQQNHSSKNELKANIKNADNHPIQELKLINNETQFLFKKHQRGNREKSKESLNDAKHQNQVFSRSQNAQNGVAHKKPQMFSENLSSSGRLTPKQQYYQIQPIQKGKRQYKHQKIPPPSPQAASEPQPLPQKQIQKQNKKQMKLSKKIQKQKQKMVSFGTQSQPPIQNISLQHKNQLQNQLLQIFKQKYSYYLIANKIVYPIQDRLFYQYQQLQPEITGRNIHPQQLVTHLSPNFSKELQIWNMIIEHPAFFQIEQQILINDVNLMLQDQDSPPYKKLFKNIHKFYINDIIFQKYEDSSSEDYFSFISLWRYADENGFLDKLFHTSWNKFILLYISLQKNYSNQQIIQELTTFETLLQNQLEKGIFRPSKDYSLLLDYLIFLINMCFQTQTFKALINNKMNFFRDNNKMKNQLLDEKKNIQNQLWQLKENDKQINKREKANIKQLKKEQKQQLADKVDELQKQNQDIYQQKIKINSQRQKLNQKIIQIDNKIYQLCCLPQFSNVWLLGEDRQRNLYWFIRQHQNAIYRQCRLTGQWGMIEYQNIELFHQQLNLRGIKQHKLYEKILYYKQLGYIKTERGSNKQLPQQTSTNKIEAQEQPIQVLEQQQKNWYDASEFDKFSYMQFKVITTQIIKVMILKSEWMMSRYLYQRNSKWIAEEQRQEYINKIIHHDLADYEALTQELRTFNQKICVVEINIKIANQNEGIQNKTRKIQTKIWGINQKYKHFWYDYSRKCRSVSDLHFLVSVLYLTIEKYVNKTRKPNNTKYFFKTVQFGQNNEGNQGQQNFGEQEML